MNYLKTKQNIMKNFNLRSNGSNKEEVFYQIPIDFSTKRIVSDQIPIDFLISNTNSKHVEDSLKKADTTSYEETFYSKEQCYKLINDNELDVFKEFILKCGLSEKEKIINALYYSLEFNDRNYAYNNGDEFLDELKLKNVIEKIQFVFEDWDNIAINKIREYILYLNEYEIEEILNSISEYFPEFDESLIDDEEYYKIFEHKNKPFDFFSDRQYLF